LVLLELEIILKHSLHNSLDSQNIVDSLWAFRENFMTVLQNEWTSTRIWITGTFESVEERVGSNTTTPLAMWTTKASTFFSLIDFWRVEDYQPSGAFLSNHFCFFYGFPLFLALLFSFFGPHSSYYSIKVKGCNWPFRLAHIHLNF